MNTYAQPLFKMQIAKIKTEDVLSVLQPIWLSKPETASRLRGRIERVLDAAKVKGIWAGENPARGRGHLDLLLPKRSKTEVKHHAALAFVEIAAFMVKLSERTAIAARAMKFAILTAARSVETRGATWAELNIESKLWTVPGNRMKAGATHQVPLSDAAIAVIMALRKNTPKPTDLVFKARFALSPRCCSRHC